jgi:hypothetical protein
MDGGQMSESRTQLIEATGLTRAAKLADPAGASAEWRDDVIRTLAECEADVLDRLVESQTDRNSWALCFRQALHLLHERHFEIERLRAQLMALRSELRRYTAAAVHDRRAA